jgi:uncharacterized protein
MARLIFIVPVTLTFMYGALCLVLFAFQRSLIYYPQPKSATDNSPTLTLNIEGERIIVSTRAGRGHYAVIYFGGNAEYVAYSLPTLGEAFPERFIYALNYRGYGGSTGKPSEAAIIQDALYLFDRIHADHPNVIVIGRSLGSGVAIQVASQRPVERLVLVTPYDSLLNIAASQFRFFPLRRLMLDKFESWRFAPKLNAPTSVIAAQPDEVIPFARTQGLLKYLPPSLTSLTVIPGVDHNSISESPEYIPALRGTP